MIYLDIRGRTGNQLFQYAFVKRIQRELSIKEICICFNKAYEKNYENDLTAFGISDYVEDKDYNVYRNSFPFVTKLLISTVKALEKLCRGNQRKRFELESHLADYLSRYNIIFMRDGYYEYDLSKYDKTKNIFVVGGFEDKRYFNKEDTKRYVVKSKSVICNKLLDIIQNSNSICVSIRRGDFLWDKFRSFNVCNIGYFVRAFKKMNELVPDAKFVIFSDDIKWCRETMSDWPYDIHFENEGNSIPDKIFLMSNCSHFIISNSSFSWWVQYLSENKNKIVISPSIWSRDENVNSLLEEGFLKIHIDCKE